MRSLNQLALSGSNAATISGAAIDGNGLFRASVQASFGDTAIGGTLRLQGSNDPAAANNQAGLTTPTHWSDIATAAVTAGALTAIQSTEICWRYLRVSLTVTAAGSTTVTAYISAFGQ